MFRHRTYPRFANRYNAPWPHPTSRFNMLHRAWILVVFVTVMLLVACGETPAQVSTDRRLSAINPATLSEDEAAGWEQTPGASLVPTLVPTVDEVGEFTSPTPVIQLPDGAPPPSPSPPPSGGGIRPDQAVLFRPADVGPSAPVDWRPPPVPVPHSLHPDDHYWLARPIASDRRNYDLEWYPYGNRPTRPEALPYRVHHGMDFPNEPGTTVFAASSGTVIWAAPLPSNRDRINYYGNTVVIHHDWQWQGEDVFTLYAHTLELFVKVGDYVEQGQLIAGVGATGDVSGPHLHLEIRIGNNNYNSTRNPALWLAPYEGWGTLAGRFMDSRGRLIHGASVSVIPLSVNSTVDVSVRRQRTYAPEGINSDEIWQENFVVADLPAGEYRVVLSTGGSTFRREMTIQPGKTNYIIMQADFQWSPTPTPAPTLPPISIPFPTPTPTSVDTE